MTDMLLNPAAAGMGLRERNTARSAVCTLPRTGLKRSVNFQTTEGEKKNITVDNEQKEELLEDRRISPAGEFL